MAFAASIRHASGPPVRASKTMNVTGIASRPCRTRTQRRGKLGRPSSANATRSPSSTSPVGRLASSGRRSAIAQPRRLLTSSPSSVDTILATDSDCPDYLVGTV